MRSHTFRTVAIALAAGWLPLAAAQPADDLPSRVSAAVDRHAPQALSLLEDVVNINSGTMNLAGVRKVGDVSRASSARSASRRAG